MAVRKIFEEIFPAVFSKNSSGGGRVSGKGKREEGLAGIWASVGEMEICVVLGEIERCMQREWMFKKVARPSGNAVLNLGRRTLPA